MTLPALSVEVAADTRVLTGEVSQISGQRHRNVPGNSSTPRGSSRGIRVRQAGYTELCENIAEFQRGHVRHRWRDDICRQNRIPAEMNSRCASQRLNDTETTCGRFSGSSGRPGAGRHHDRPGALTCGSPRPRVQTDAPARSTSASSRGSGPVWQITFYRVAALLTP